MVEALLKIFGKPKRLLHAPDTLLSSNAKRVQVLNALLSIEISKQQNIHGIFIYSLT